MKFSSTAISTTTGGGARTTNAPVRKAGAASGGVKPTTTATTGSNGLKSRTLHLKIDCPQIRGKTRAHGVKIALAIIMGASKHIKLLPK